VTLAPHETEPKEAGPKETKDAPGYPGIDDIQFEKRWFRFERTAWVGMSLILLAACLGFTGPGPLTKAEARDGSDRLRVEYPRIVHAQAMHELWVELQPSATREGRAIVILKGALTGTGLLPTALPPPSSQESSQGALRWTFDMAPGSQSRILVQARPVRPGKIHSQIEVEGGGQVNLSQWVMP
jgi:hypothetical protein